MSETEAPPKPVFRWYESCGCLTLLAMLLVFVWFGGPLADLIAALAEWVGRH